MRKSLAVVFGVLVICSAPALADDKAEMRALLDKAIRAHGADAGKVQAATMKMKGTIHVQNMALDFNGDLSVQGPDQQRVAIDLSIGGQNVTVINVLNRDKGWVKINDAVVDLDKDKVAQAKEEAYAGWLQYLTPLKDDAYTLAPLGEIKIDDRPATGMRVSSQGHRDVSLYFDKKTHLLVKIESRVKDEERGQEVTQETFLSGYDEKAPMRQALKLKVHRDGKLFADAEITDFKAVDKLDDSVFGKP